MICRPIVSGPTTMPRRVIQAALISLLSGSLTREHMQGRNGSMVAGPHLLKLVSICRLQIRQAHPFDSGSRVSVVFSMYCTAGPVSFPPASSPSPAILTPEFCWLWWDAISCTSHSLNRISLTSTSTGTDGRLGYNINALSLVQGHMQTRNGSIAVGPHLHFIRQSGTVSKMPVRLGIQPFSAYVVFFASQCTKIQNLMHPKKAVHKYFCRGFSLYLVQLEG
jgi:hypothetical protein